MTACIAQFWCYYLSSMILKSHPLYLIFSMCCMCVSAIFVTKVIVIICSCLVQLSINPWSGNFHNVEIMCTNINTYTYMIVQTDNKWHGFKFWKVEWNCHVLMESVVRKPMRGGIHQLTKVTDNTQSRTFSCLPSCASPLHMEALSPIPSPPLLDNVDKIMWPLCKCHVTT